MHCVVCSSFIYHCINTNLLRQNLLFTIWVEPRTKSSCFLFVVSSVAIARKINLRKQKKQTIKEKQIWKQRFSMPFMSFVTPTCCFTPQAAFLRNSAIFGRIWQSGFAPFNILIHTHTRTHTHTFTYICTPQSKLFDTVCVLGVVRCTKGSKPGHPRILVHLFSSSISEYSLGSSERCCWNLETVPHWCSCTSCCPVPHSAAGYSLNSQSSAGGGCCPWTRCNLWPVSGSGSWTVSSRKGRWESSPWAFRRQCSDSSSVVFPACWQLTAAEGACK